MDDDRACGVEVTSSGHDGGASLYETQRLLDAPIRTSRPASRQRSAINGPLMGRIVGFQGITVPLVTFMGQPGAAALPARTTVDLCGEHVGDEVVLLFEACDPLRPIVVGRVRVAKAWPAADKPDHVEVEADGQRLAISAAQQIVLSCGRARITLTAAGKIIVDGTYLLSRSSGVNQIAGGSVQIN